MISTLGKLLTPSMLSPTVVYPTRKHSFSDSFCLINISVCFCKRIENKWFPSEGRPKTRSGTISGLVFAYFEWTFFFLTVRMLVVDIMLFIFFLVYSLDSRDWIMSNFLYHIHTLTEDFLRRGKLYRQSSANIRQKTPWELSVQVQHVLIFQFLYSVFFIYSFDIWNISRINTKKV